MAFRRQMSGDTVDAGAFSMTDDDPSTLKNSAGDKIVSKNEKLLEMKHSCAGKITMQSSSSSTIASSSALNSENQFVYNMDHPKVGHCLIINNENFTSGMSRRKGTDRDEAALKKTFGALGFKVTVHKDLTKKQMMHELETMSKEDHSDCAAFVCVLLSHGNEEEIYGTDKPVRLQDLTEHFHGDVCKSLLEKPKLFFIQACRGIFYDGEPGKDGVDCDPQPIRKKIPVEADCLYAYATPPGFYAIRNEDNGSWFIQSLCEILPEHKHLELMQILTRVNRKVAFDFETTHGKKAVPCITSMLTKEFYFPQ